MNKLTELLNCFLWLFIKESSLCSESINFKIYQIIWIMHLLRLNFKMSSVLSLRYFKVLVLIANLILSGLIYPKKILLDRRRLSGPALYSLLIDTFICFSLLSISFQYFCKLEKCKSLALFQVTLLPWNIFKVIRSQ